MTMNNDEKFRTSFILGLITSILGSLIVMFLAFTSQKIGDMQNNVIGFSTEWKSAWIDLSSPSNFNKGGQLRLKIRGNPEEVKVRLLPEGNSPNDPIGVVQGVYEVDPSDGLVTVSLSEDYSDIVQISVHAGSNPWGLFPLNNGSESPILESYEVVY